VCEVQAFQCWLAVGARASKNEDLRGWYATARAQLRCDYAHLPCYSRGGSRHRCCARGCSCAAGRRCSCARSGAPGAPGSHSIGPAARSGRKRCCCAASLPDTPRGRRRCGRAGAALCGRRGRAPPRRSSGAARSAGTRWRPPQTPPLRRPVRAQPLAGPPRPQPGPAAAAAGPVARPASRALRRRPRPSQRPAMWPRRARPRAVMLQG